MTYKSDFPLLREHPEIIYLDNAATTQKPQKVIDTMKQFLTESYANIHRGNYSLSEAAETIYYKSKSLVAELLHCSSKEIIYTYNATYAVNLLAQSLVKSKFLQKGDVVLVGIWDHHANSLPWMSLAELFWFEVQFFSLNAEYEIDREDFQKKYTDKVKVVACGHVSNVTWGIYDIKKIWSLLREDTFFIVDASQSVPNMVVDMQEIWCDALVFTGHKIMASTGIGILALKQQRIKTLQPIIVGGGTIKDVSISNFVLESNASKFEAWTPNILGAASLLAALEYIASISPSNSLHAGMEIIAQHEHQLAQFALKKFQALEDKVQLIGPKNNKRVALFSFLISGKENFNQTGEFFAEKNICIRCGGHCAYPLHKHFNIGGTCRMSAYLYNDEAEIQAFFERLETLIYS